MPQPNEMIAALLQEYAEPLQISGGDPFRARSYEKAAKAVAGFGGDVSLHDATSLRPDSRRRSLDRDEDRRVPADWRDQGAGGALMLVRAAQLLLRDQPGAEDVVQDAFLSLYRVSPRLHDHD